LGQTRETILKAVNDVYHKGYSKKYFVRKGNAILLSAYENSLFRGDDPEYSEISSEYAKESRNILKKIRASTISICNSEDENKDLIKKLIYGAVITTLESYLGDAFKYNVINNKSYFYSFLKNFDFGHEDKEYRLSELGLQGDNIGKFIEERVKKIMNEQSFHNLHLVKKLYKKILNINLPENLMKFQEAVQKRHDIFHRNGKNIDGIELKIEEGDIYELVTEVENIIKEIETILEART